jgi:hypothetical protein
MRDRFDDGFRDARPPKEVPDVVERTIGSSLEDGTDLGVRDPVHVLQSEPYPVPRVLGVGVAR